MGVREVQIGVPSGESHLMPQLKSQSEVLARCAHASSQSELGALTGRRRSDQCATART